MPYCKSAIFQQGGVAERFKAPVLKIGVRLTVDREFESRPLRQLNYFELRISEFEGHADVGLPNTCRR